MTTLYYRAIPRVELTRSMTARTIAGGWAWFDQIEVLGRGLAPYLIPADDAPEPVLAAISAPRAPMVGMTWDAPRLMAILNVTPDSFSDGGAHDDLARAVTEAGAQAQFADILDIGGESTRPGAATVEVSEEIARTQPVIAALAQAGGMPPISIDTRKAVVAETALAAGAVIVNDVAALGYDPAMADVVRNSGAPVCLMHAQGAPETMQNDPRYSDVLLDVYDALSQKIETAMRAGISRDRIIVDPGIGFGKTMAHNLELLNRLSLFHTLGCVVLVGASRKRFIGTLSDGAEPQDRVAGSVAVTLNAVAQGVQILRVHDTKDHNHALALWQAQRTATAPEAL
jgi:dihydropteroate synthase